MQEPSIRRPIFICQNMLDGAASVEVGEGIVEFLQNFPDKYAVDYWFPEGDCNGEAHSMSVVRYPTKYREKMCTFFYSAFNMNDASCHDINLPELEGNAHP